MKDNSKLTKTDVPGFFRSNENHGSIIHKDPRALESYKAKKRNTRKLDRVEKEIRELENRIAQLELSLGDK